MFRAGQLVVYRNGSRIELGKIKCITEDGTHARVWYHGGETTALTRIEDLYPIVNDYCIVVTAFGGGAK